MYKMGRDDIKQKSAYLGNSMKSMHVSVEESLKKLRTTYIDILYVHWVSRCRRRMRPDMPADVSIVGLDEQH